MYSAVHHINAVLYLVKSTLQQNSFLKDVISFLPLTFSVCNNTKLYKSLQRDFYIWQKCNQNEEVVQNIPVISNAIFKKYVFLSRVPVRDLFVVMVETFKELSEFWHLKSWIFYRAIVTCSTVLFFYFYLILIDENAFLNIIKDVICWVFFLLLFVRILAGQGVSNK